jgi:hypothetical protein
VGRTLHVGNINFCNRVIGIYQETYAGKRWSELSYDFETLRAKRAEEKTYTGNVAYWPIETRDKSEFDRIASVRENDRN